MGNQQNTPILALQQQRLLLQMEYQAEKEAYRKQTEEMGLQRKVKRGDAWWPVKMGKSYYNSLNQLVVEVYRQGEDDEIEHNFEFGRPVAFFTCNPKDPINPRDPRVSSDPRISYFPFTATVSYVDGDRMVVAVPDNGQLIDVQGAENVGIQLFFDETSYKMMFEALDRVMRAKGRLGYLRDLFYSPSRADGGGMRAETFSFAPMHFPYLNQTQEDAVNKVLRAKDVAIVHGPPGTGKTTTLVEAIYETLRRENQVLVCAQSNMAVDWISEKLVDRGINVLRIGNPTRVNDKMLSFTYERRFESHPDYELLWAIRKAIRDLRSHRKRGDERFHQKMERLKERATELELRINAQLFGEARVIACTLVGSANRLLEGQKFGTLFIDEAAQALEAACWIPIRRVSRVILAGDHCQLPPTIKSFAAMKAGLGKTLMERIVENKPETVTLLKMQYRMNEEIMRFSSDWFYGNKVESAPEVKYRSILDLDIPMTWIDTSEFNGQLIVDSYDYQTSAERKGMQGNHNCPLSTIHYPLFREEFVGESFGRINKAEAELTLLALETYFKKIGKERILDERLDVGVISPYRAQVQYLRRLFKKREFFKPYRSLISVNTVDGFQGQERDIILISLVRANDEGQIGFLRDLRRMNVAITRARMKLIILGDASTMTRHPFYKKLYEYIDAL
ncbi:MAG: AAA family ATPase [Prevotella sp.]|nr:AAA family ATPase [Prevotella sp.]